MKLLGKKFLKCECCNGYHFIEHIKFLDNTLYHACQVNRTYYQTTRDVLDTQVLKFQLKKGVRK